MAASTAHLQIEGVFSFCFSMHFLDSGIFWLTVSNFVFIYCETVLNELCYISERAVRECFLPWLLKLILGTQFKHIGSC